MWTFPVELYGTCDLWLGAISDSDYNRWTGHVDEQEEFQKINIVYGSIIPFLNICDKGRREKMAAWQHGKQQAIRPDWTVSDRRFDRIETIGSTSVTSDRGSNERFVNVSKREGYVSRGLEPNMDPVRMNKAWRTWRYQSNFMFKPVL